MSLKDCYAAFGGSYEDVRDRIPKDEIIKKFLFKFLTEPSYDNLCKYLECENYTEAFRAAHSLKGVSQNLGLAVLEKSSSAITELLRNSEEKQVNKEGCKELLKQVTSDYSVVIGAIELLKAEE